MLGTHCGEVTALPHHSQLTMLGHTQALCQPWWLFGGPGGCGTRMRGSVERQHTKIQHGFDARPPQQPGCCLQHESCAWGCLNNASDGQTVVVERWKNFF